MAKMNIDDGIISGESVCLRREHNFQMRAGCGCETEEEENNKINRKPLY